jgi:hypothetical protein
MRTTDTLYEMQKKKKSEKKKESHTRTITCQAMNTAIQSVFNIHHTSTFSIHLFVRFVSAWICDELKSFQILKIKAVEKETTTILHETKHNKGD